MPRKFDGATCVFCRRNPSSTTGEHVPPLWFLEMFGLAEGPYTIEDGGESRLKRGGDVRWHESIPKLTLPACDDLTGENCNGKLGKRFEQPAKEVVRGLCAGTVHLEAPDAQTFGIWLLKTWLELAHPEGHFSSPGGFGEPWDLSKIAADLYGWMVNGQPPPDGLNLFVSRLDPRDEESGVERHALLPIGSHLYQYAQSFLAAGMLDVTLIHNATQPIAHPLAAEGGVLRVWPIAPADTLDLGSLPYVNRRDLAFLAA